MRQSLKFLETLSPAQIRNIITVLEKGLELEKLEYLATKNPETRERINATCVFLSILYFRKLNINRPISDFPDDLL